MNRRRLIFIGGLIFAVTLLVAQTLPKAQLPVLTTSAGQSQDVTILNTVLEEAGIKYDYCDVPTAEMVAAGVGLGGKESAPGFHVESSTDTARFPKGTAYRTVIFAIGASLKGMGASGLTLDAEVARLDQVIGYCQKNKIFMIGVHAGGESKRGASGSDNERMIDTVAPRVNFLIVTNDSNKDGRFTKISKEKNIPLTQVEYALGLVDIFKKMFE